MVQPMAPWVQQVVVVFFEIARLLFFFFYGLFCFLPSEQLISTCLFSFSKGQFNFWLESDSFTYRALGFLFKVLQPFEAQKQPEKLSYSRTYRLTCRNLLLKHEILLSLQQPSHKTQLAKKLSRVNHLLLHIEFLRPH